MKRLIINLIKKMGLLNKAKAISRTINFSTQVRLNNTLIKTPHLYGTICKVDEPWMLELLKKLLKLKKGAFIDVGVNIGQTLIQVKAIDSARKYIGFEPNPSCNFYVEQLIRANNFTDCLIIPAGLFENDSLMKLDLYGDESTNSGGSLISNFRDFRKNNRIHRSIIVPVYCFETIDAALGINKFDILKIDVEGAELEVIKTLKKAISNNNPIILLEVLPAYSIDNTKRIDRQTAIMEIMDTLNYSIYRIIKSKTNILEGIKPVTDFGLHSDLTMCDYILVPNSEKLIIGNSFKIIE